MAAYFRPGAQLWGNIFGCVLFGACLVWGTVNPPVEGVWWWLGLIGVFADSVSLPFRMGFSRVYGVFAERDLTDDITFIGSGKLGLPENAVVAFALGVDMINVGREAMLSIGCIQAQKCHTDKCPTGIATQNPWLARGIDVPSKGIRAAMYLRTLRRELLKVSGAVGVPHPSLITPADIDILNGDYDARSLGSVYGYKHGWGSLGPELVHEIAELLTP